MKPVAPIKERHGNPYQDRDKGIDQQTREESEQERRS
jgi:hypothetical protein